MIGELVLAEELPSTGQPTRSPYFVGFSFEGSDIVFCNVHIVYGEAHASENRLLEIDAIARQPASKVDRGKDFPPNLVLLGDVQGGTDGGQILKSIESAGFILPPAIRDLPTSATTTSRGKPFDQIALILSPDFTLMPDALGVVDYFQFVYTDDQTELYKAEVEEFTVRKFSRQRTYWMSDHLPKWLTLQVNK